MGPELIHKLVYLVRDLPSKNQNGILIEVIGALDKLLELDEIYRD